MIKNNKIDKLIHDLDDDTHDKLLNIIINLNSY